LGRERREAPLNFVRREEEEATAGVISSEDSPVTASTAAEVTLRAYPMQTKTPPMTPTQLCVGVSRSQEGMGLSYRMMSWIKVVVRW
jgi:hypothetical protein